MQALFIKILVFYSVQESASMLASYMSRALHTTSVLFCPVKFPIRSIRLFSSSVIRILTTCVFRCASLAAALVRSFHEYSSIVEYRIPFPSAMMEYQLPLLSITMSGYRVKSPFTIEPSSMAYMNSVAVIQRSLVLRNLIFIVLYLSFKIAEINIHIGCEFFHYFNNGFHCFLFREIIL